MADRGWHADLCLIQPDQTAGPEVERALTTHAYDCVVIGAGIRLPPHSLSIFEAVINAVHRGARRALSPSIRVQKGQRSARTLPLAGFQPTEQQRSEGFRLPLPALSDKRHQASGHFAKFLIFALRCSDKRRGPGVAARPSFRRCGLSAAYTE